jgi:hypothetical protein
MIEMIEKIFEKMIFSIIQGDQEWKDSSGSHLTHEECMHVSDMNE